MKRLEFIATTVQRNELEALAYRIADIAYMREKYGNDEPEITVSRKTIEDCIFPKCDALCIPYWVQNSIIAWAENWRRTKAESLQYAMRQKGIIL